MRQDLAKAMSVQCVAQLQLSRKATASIMGSSSTRKILLIQPASRWSSTARTVSTIWLWANSSKVVGSRHDLFCRIGHFTWFGTGCFFVGFLNFRWLKLPGLASSGAWCCFDEFDPQISKSPLIRHPLQFLHTAFCLGSTESIWKCSP